MALDAARCNKVCFVYMRQEETLKRVTILFDDEHLYRDLKAEAAKEGRSVKDIVAEALRTWLRSRTGLTLAQRERRSSALRELDEIRSSQPARTVVEDLLAELRDEGQ